MLMFLYGDAVFNVAGQKDEVLQLQSFVLTLNVFLDLLQLRSKLVNQLQGCALSEVLLCVLAQRNLGRKKHAKDKQSCFYIGGLVEADDRPS